MNYENLGDLLFPHIEKTRDDYEKIYPKRQMPEGAKVTRLGPSPTGFIHLGNLYGAFADERLAHQSGGLFYLRIEDTDEKRYVEGAVNVIIESLGFFGIDFDEGTTKEGENGSYGPYSQSLRKDIYQCFAKDLVKKGLAYPCFLTSEEIDEIRENQEENKENPGIYGSYALSRNLSMEDVEKNIKEGKPYVLRLRSKGLPPVTGEDKAVAEENKTAYISVEDGIRGTLTMPENYQDVVILKTSGIPTYHFAHVVDDYLMRTTHVVRGAEWLPSLPIHVELFNALELPLPIYCHTAQLMKIDDETGQKRKLSKRSDPELSLDFYRKLGYHPQALREYLLTLLNSNFEEWRLANPRADVDEFQFTTEKMAQGGALFDLNKLNDVSKEVMLNISSKDIYSFLLKWSKEFRPEFLPELERDPEYLYKILDIGRKDNKPRKDLVFAEQIMDFISYFFQPYFKIEDSIPENVSKEDAKAILEGYINGYNHEDDQEAWFGKIRSLGESLGYAGKPKDFKKNPELYKGHVGDVSTVIRLAITGRAQSPDIWEIQQILGEEKTRDRLSRELN